MSAVDDGLKFQFEDLFPLQILHLVVVVFYQTLQVNFTSQHKLSNIFAHITTMQEAYLLQVMKWLDLYWFLVGITVYIGEV